MEDYIKAVLYAYPFLKRTEETYGECIRNKALLSYRSGKNAETVAEAIAKEILEKENLLWLKERVESVLEKMTAGEKALVAVRFFGKKDKINPIPYAELERGQWQDKSVSDRQYFRLLNRVGEKAAALLVAEGVTKDCYEKNFSGVDVLKQIGARLKRMQGVRTSLKENAYSRSGVECLRK